MEFDSQQVCEDLLNLLKRLKASLGDLAELYDLTPIQLHAMYAIAEESMTMGGLAKFLHCDASNATGIVDRLVIQKLVKRVEKAHDRRAKTLVLTSEGKKVMDAITTELPTQLGSEKLSASERSTLHDIVTKLA